LIEKKFNDWVLPGVEEVRARPRTASKELITLDFPTLDRPRKAISGLKSAGQSASVKALLMNSALVTFIRSLIDSDLEGGNCPTFKVALVF